MGTMRVANVFLAVALLGIAACGSMRPHGMPTNERFVADLKSSLEESTLDEHVKQGCLNVLQDAAHTIEPHRRNQELLAALYLGSEYLSWTTVAISQDASETSIHVQQDSGEVFELSEAAGDFKSLRADFNSDYGFNKTRRPRQAAEIDHDSCIIALDKSGDHIRYFVTSTSRFSAGKEGSQFLSAIEIILARR